VTTKTGLIVVYFVIHQCIFKNEHFIKGFNLEVVHHSLMLKLISKAITSTFSL